MTKSADPDQSSLPRSSCAGDVGWKDDLPFYVLFKVFQSHQDNEQMIMKGFVQWSQPCLVL